jgi:hypothetical protein
MSILLVFFLITGIPEVLFAGTFASAAIAGRHVKGPMAVAKHLLIGLALAVTWIVLATLTSPGY